LPLLLFVSALAAARANAAPLAVKVSGNQLIDGNGRTIRLIGVNRSGTEYRCVSRWAGIFDGPSDDASIAAMASWHINTVRVPLNEDCWLGINVVNPQYSGAAYRSAIVDYVNRLHRYGLYAVLDLHWNSTGFGVARKQQEMADANFSPAFWRSVANTFKGDPATLFDLYNEPHGSASKWPVWHGGGVSPAGWQMCGMQTMVDAVRGTGATNVLVVTGAGWGNDMFGWLANMPEDPLKQIVASIHVYDTSGCKTAACYDSVLPQIIARVPLVAGEFGEHDCGHAQVVDPLMNWFDAHGAGYLGWAWDSGEGWNCRSGPGLIENYSGTPNSYGIGLQMHLAAQEH
jgi:hypothetical protein